MPILIKGKEYTFCSDIRDNEQIRHSYTKLALGTFGIDFEQWHQKGYWGGSYIPYVLLDGDRVVSGVAVNIMDVQLDGTTRRYVQLGTVMTDPNYRGKGLNRWLMERVIGEWKEKCDCIFLFGNDTVTNFYPRFGFVKAQEYQVTKPIRNREGSFRKLDMSSTEDKALLLAKYSLSNPFSRLEIVNNVGLLMFYCTLFMKENIYYIEKFDAVVIAESDGDRLCCYDVFSDGSANLDDILGVLAGENTKAAVFEFTPKDSGDCDTKELHKEDTTLFLLGGMENPFLGDKLMFPELSHT